MVETVRASALHKETSFVLCPSAQLKVMKKPKSALLLLSAVALLLNKYSYLKDTMSLLEQYREMCVVAVVSFSIRD